MKNLTERNCMENTMSMGAIWARFYRDYSVAIDRQEIPPAVKQAWKNSLDNAMKCLGMNGHMTPATKPSEKEPLCATVKNLIKFKKAHNLTFRELGEMTKIKWNTICNWASRACKPTRRNKKKIRKFLNRQLPKGAFDDAEKTIPGQNADQITKG